MCVSQLGMPIEMPWRMKQLCEQGHGEKPAPVGVATQNHAGSTLSRFLKAVWTVIHNDHRFISCDRGQQFSQRQTLPAAPQEIIPPNETDLR